MNDQVIYATENQVPQRPLKRSQMYAAVVERGAMTNALDRALSALSDLNGEELDILLEAAGACGVSKAIGNTSVAEDGLKMPAPVLEAVRLALTKGKDYNARVGRDAYFPLGLQSYAHEIYKKGLRLVNLSATGDAPNHESIRDTALDLINYSWFLADAIDRGVVLK